MAPPCAHPRRGGNVRWSPGLGGARERPPRHEQVPTAPLHAWVGSRAAACAPAAPCVTSSGVRAGVSVCRPCPVRAPLSDAGGWVGGPAFPLRRGGAAVWGAGLVVVESRGLPTPASPLLFLSTRPHHLGASAADRSAAVPILRARTAALPPTPFRGRRSHPPPPRCWLPRLKTSPRPPPPFPRRFPVSPPPSLRPAGWASPPVWCGCCCRAPPARTRQCNTSASPTRCWAWTSSARCGCIAVHGCPFPPSSAPLLLCIRMFVFTCHGVDGVVLLAAVPVLRRPRPAWARPPCSSLRP
jgi:hypothetical protein